MAGNPNFFRKIDFQLAQILDLPKFSQEEGGEGLDTKKSFQKGRMRDPMISLKVLLRERVRVWLITKSWTCKCSLERTKVGCQDFSSEEGESASSVQSAEY